MRDKAAASVRRQQLTRVECQRHSRGHLVVDWTVGIHLSSNEAHGSTEGSQR